MALKLGTGSEAYAPLARAIIGGLAVSVVLTVFIVPAAYLILYRRREAAKKKFRGCLCGHFSLNELSNEPDYFGCWPFGFRFRAKSLPM